MAGVGERVRLCLWVLALVLPLTAWSAAVTSAFPLVPLRPGASTVEVGVEVQGPAEQVLISVSGQSATEGTFASLSNVVVDRDQAGAVAFHTLVSFSRPFPEDGVLEVVARPVGDGEDTALTQRFDATAPPPRFGPAPLRVRADLANHTITLELAYEGGAIAAEASVVGASAEELRRVHGSLEDVEPVSFLQARRVLARPSSATPGRIVFAIPLTAEQIPHDGVVIADVALKDAFGRMVHTSAVEFTQSSTFDPVVGVSVEPSPLLLSEGFGQRVLLQVTGSFAIAGEVDLSGPHQGVEYRSIEEAVASVTEDGQVVARGNGETDIEVSYAGYTATARVVVDSTAVVERLEVLPASALIPRVGGSLRLGLEGVLSDGRRVDLSPRSLGTTWRSLDPGVLTVSTDGRAVGLRPGTARVEAHHAGYSALRVVEVLDGPPEISLSSPAQVVAGAEFELKAHAKDDVALASVEFLVNGVAASRMTAPPFVIKLRAPPVAGGEMVLGAVAVDTNGSRTRAAELTLKVQPGQGASSVPIVYEQPLPGALLLEGLPQTVRLTSGDWRTGELSPRSFQLVRFYADGALIGTSRTPRIEMRNQEADPAKPPRPVAVPQWEVSYVPRSGTAGTVVALYAEAVDASGATARGATVLVRIARDRPPLVSLRSPSGPRVQTTAGRPLVLTGLVEDDAVTLGVELSLLVDGAQVSSTRLVGEGLGGTRAGSAPFSIEWRPPTTSIGRLVRLQFVARDVADHEARASLEASVVADAPPQIALQTPVPGSQVLAGTAQLLTASVVDDSAGEVEVTWRVDGVPVGASRSPPYRTSWTVPASAAGRTLQLQATARDVTGNEAQASGEVFVVSDTSRPTVSIVVPRPLEDVPETQDLVVTVAGQDDATVTRVEVLLEGAVLDTDESPGPNGAQPGSFLTHTLLRSAQLQGREQIRLGARAYDASGNMGSAPEVLVRVLPDAAPTVRFVLPTAHSRATIGTQLELIAEADDDVAVSAVEFFSDGHSSCRATLPPYRCTISVAGPPRTLNLRAVASDSGGRSAAAEVALQVNEDTEPPLVAFRAPSEGSLVFAGRSLSVEVAASDDVGVRDVRLELDGQPVGTQSGGVVDGLYRLFRWQVPVPAAAAGRILVLKAVATDTSGLSRERSLEVRARRDEVPVVSITSPAPNSFYKEGEDVRLVVTVADDEGVVGLVGLSGGQRQGPLPVSGAPMDVSRPLPLTVRAPSISQGAPLTVGAEARDTAGQSGLATVTLQVAPDTEPPTALLTSPLPPATGRLQVNEGGAFSLRVQVEDDVRVVRVAAVVDGQELPPVDGREPLGPQSERFEEVRQPNPVMPGEILISRRYLGTFAGTVGLSRYPPGLHTLAARAYDAGGNVTSTTQVSFEILEVQDLAPPRVTLTLLGGPDERTCVAGAPLKLRVSATDDVSIREASVTFEGEPVAISQPPAQGPRSWQEEIPFQLPPLGSGGRRTVTFMARVTDGAQRAGVVSRSCELAPDGPPLVQVVLPTARATLTEERTEPVAVDVRDDVGVRRGLRVLSTSTVVVPGIGDFEVEALAAHEGLGVPRATLIPGEGPGFTVEALEGRLRLSPPGEGQGTQREAPGRLRLSVEPSPSGHGAQAQVRFRYTVKPGHEGSAALQAFRSSFPEGVGSLMLSAPAFFADLSFPAQDIELEEVDVQLSKVSPGAEELAVTRLALRGWGTPQLQLRAEATGERVAVQRWTWGQTASPPGQVKRIEGSVWLPLGQAPRESQLTVLAEDVAGLVGSAAVPLVTRADTEPPTVSILAPGNGASVVEDTVFEVLVNAQDNARLDQLELWVDGTSRQVMRVGPPSSGTPQPYRFSLALPLPASGYPVALSVVARDGAGSATASDTSYVRVIPDVAPSVTFQSLSSAVETFTRTELDSGYVVMLQGTPATLGMLLEDDAGLVSVRVLFGEQVVKEESFTGAPLRLTRQVTFTPPVGRDGAPAVLLVSLTDTAGHTREARLLIESRRPRAPALALAAPTPGATIAEGSIQLTFDAVAVDDTAVAHVQLFINGQPALLLREGLEIPWSVDEVTGAVVITDPALRHAVSSLPPEDQDLQRLRHYRGQVKLPPGFVALVPGRPDAALQLRTVATDKEGHQTVLDQPLRIEEDIAAPLVDVLRPVLGRNVVEGTSVLVEVLARDNVLVDRVEISAGPSATDMRVVNTVGGFPPTNAIPGSPFDVYAPLVRYSLTVPTLAQLGSTVPVPYFISARARDISGNWTEFADVVIQPIEIIQDQPPAVAILSPPDGTPAVSGSTLTVVAMAEDDVAVGNVRLEVDGVPLPLTLHTPPFTFQVPVPDRPGELRLRAVAVDSGGREVGSQVVILPLREDRAPTVAVAQPRPEARLTEGRDFALVVAAQDDVAIRSVEVLVEGGLAGPLRFVASSLPYSFRVPLPPGSAGRTLRMLARARDSAGHETVAPEVTALVVTDTSRPTVTWLHPAQGSQVLEGMVLDLEVDARDDVAVTSL
ncbi:Ig-like domain-containing protein, partial [Hyalangium sp.]|uniref:Ig-like domain-containing protein n=1 Tax=Hyalangium sp. TaxID=2028555 RepID=UPI002D2F6077